MLVTISSGNGVDEVCRAIWHFLHWLKKSYDFKVLHLEYAACKDGYKSVVLESNDRDFLQIEGTHLWRCQSPFRVKHKRKNWYFTVSIQSEMKVESIDRSKVVYQTMKSPKKGGQHVNTTCSGVRAIYPPLGLEALSYDERSQHRNKAIALARLIAKVSTQANMQKRAEQNERWREAKALERGNAVKVFEGVGFIEMK